MTTAESAPKNAGTDKETIAAARRAALNATLEASGLTPHALARMAGIDGGNLRAAASGAKGMGDEKWLKVAAASPAGTALRELFPEVVLATIPASITAASGAPATGIIGVPFSKLTLNPDNYRKTFDEAELVNLADSIVENGILQNLVVLPPVNGIYQINSGNRRYKAMALLHDTDRLSGEFIVPCLVKDITADDARALAIVENIQRQDVPVLEEAEGFRALNELGWDTGKIAKTCGLGVRTVQDRLQLTERLTAPAREALASHQITLDQARAIMSVRSEAEQADMVLHAVKHDYTAAALRDKAKRGKPSIAAAEFDVADYKGEFLGEGKHRVFADADAFTKLQRKAAAAIAATLRAETMPDDASRKRYAMVTLVPQGERFEQWHYRDAKPSEDAEAFVWVEAWNHKIETATGLVAKSSAGTAADDNEDDDEESTVAQASADAAREARKAETNAFEQTIRAHYIKHPVDMLRMMIMNEMTESYSGIPYIECNFAHPELQDSFRAALGMPELFKVYDDAGTLDESSFEMPSTAEEMAEIWSRLQALDMPAVAALIVSLVVPDVNYQPHNKLNPADLLLALSAKIEVPAFMQPVPAEPAEAESEAA